MPYHSDVIIKTAPATHGVANTLPFKFWLHEAGILQARLLYRYKDLFYRGSIMDISRLRNLFFAAPLPMINKRFVWFELHSKSKGFSPVAPWKSAM